LMHNAMPSPTSVLRRWLPILLFFLTLALYLRTMAPGIYISDFAEFQYQPARLGLPHPNGFPLYMMLGWLWSQLPVETVAWRMNALSAAGGALCVALTAAFALRLSQRISVALLAAGLLALSPTFWFYSLAAERYTLNLALLVAVFWTAWEAGQRQSSRPAYLSALLLGLGMATHPSDALAAPFWLAYLIWRLPHLRRRPRFWVSLALAGLAPILLYVYVPWRWAVFSAWPLLPGLDRSSAIFQGMVHVWYQPQLTWPALRIYITGIGDAATGLLGGGWRSALPAVIGLAPTWADDLPRALLAMSGLGGLRLLRRDAALALALAGFAALIVVMTAYIEQGKPHAYLLPATWVALFFAGFAADLALAGAARLARRRSRPVAEQPPAAPPGPEPTLVQRLDLLLTAAIAVALLALLGSRYAQLDYSRWNDAERAWDFTLAHHDLPAGAALLGHWSDMTPLWYMQQIDGRRPDLVALFPPDPATVIQPWLEAGGALYLAAPLNDYAPDLAQRYSLTPWGQLVRIQLPGQQAACLDLPGAAETPETWPLAVLSWDISDPLQGGDNGALRFCWQARQDLPPDTFLKLTLRSAEGQHWVDLNQPLLSSWRPGDAVPAGAEGLAVVPVALPLGAMPGLFTAELAPYRLAADGNIETWPDVAPVVLGQVTVAANQAFSRSQLRDEIAPIVAPQAGPLRLRAWQVSSLAVRPGDPVEIDLLWEVVEPVETPLVVALGFRSLPTGRLAAPPRLFQLLEPAAGLQPGDLLRTRHVAPAPRSQGNNRYLVEARVQQGTDWLSWRPTVRLPIGLVQVQERARLADVPPHATPAQASFGGLAELAGYSLEPAAPHAGGALTATLYWRALVEQDRSYTVFVHLVDAAGRIVAQHDGIPANGDLPTQIWLANEVVADPHTLWLPPELPAGKYTVRVGIYDPASSARLSVASTAPHDDSALELFSFTQR
jgi:hypothetical protein